jgi:hypothetical protein
MVRLLNILLAVWLTGMFASGSASAAFREIDLGVLSPGSAAGLFGVFPFGVESTDIYEFDISGAPTDTVAASAVSLLTLNPPSPAQPTFDLTLELLEWNPVTSTFDAIIGTTVTGAAVVTTADLAPATGGGNSNNRHYELTVVGMPEGVGMATYGGSIAVVAVPEASMVLLVMTGLIAVGFLGRRRLAPGSV